MAAINPMPDPDDLDHPGEMPPVIEMKGVNAGYGRKSNGEPAVMILRDIDVSIPRGKTIGVIGESGSGKSTLARVIAGLLPPAQGEVRIDGEVLPDRVEKRTKDELRKIQFVYQMADTALNPRQRIKDILGRPLTFYKGLRGSARNKRVLELLEMVELPPPFAERYPHELSGGQKQRVNLARALAADPEVVLCDEVTSALDTIVASNVINLLTRLQQETGVSFVFISHDLSTVASFCDDIIVMYQGRVVDAGAVKDVLSPPFHPYTDLLITSVPEPRIGWLEETNPSRAGLVTSDA
jgi:peptide/nickel transport system ATP-binding protein